MENKTGNRYPVTGAVLKNIACFTMFIDHFFAVLVLNWMKLHPVGDAWDPQIEKVYHMGRHIGRLSFVFFAYLLVEGFIHTRSRVRYLMRLFIAALLSEIPFDLAFSGKIIDWSSQNIYWTLFLGMLVLTLWERIGQYRGFFAGAARGLALLAGCGAAFLFSTDYRYMGILLIFAIYKTRGRNVWTQVFTVGMVMLFGTWSANCIRYAGSGYTAVYLLQYSLRELYGLFAFVLIPFYNGKRGWQLPKPFYYGFYPVHLLFLYGLAWFENVM